MAFAAREGWHSVALECGSHVVAQYPSSELTDEAWQALMCCLSHDGIQTQACCDLLAGVLLRKNRGGSGQVGQGQVAVMGGGKTPAGGSGSEQEHAPPNGGASFGDQMVLRLTKGGRENSVQACAVAALFGVVIRSLVKAGLYEQVLRGGNCYLFGEERDWTWSCTKVRNLV